MVSIHLHLAFLAVLVIPLSVASPKNIKSVIVGGRRKHHRSTISISQIPSNDISSSRYGSSKLNESLLHESLQVRKSSDQFKWPWRNYEEWKKSQEKLEDDLDQILKPRRKPNVSESNHPSLKKVKLSARKKLNKRKHPRKKLTRRRRKKKLSHHGFPPMTNSIDAKGTPSASPLAYTVSSSGGAVLAVKYYSTDEDSLGKVIEKTPTTQASKEINRKPTITDYSEALRMRESLGPKRLLNGCSSNRWGCEEACVRKKNLLNCHCPKGFSLDFTRRKCIDTNECLTRNGHGPCQGECINVWGSFKCGCESIPGTRLSDDARTCVVVDRCATVNCSHICVNTRSGAFCSCPDGLSLDTDWITCIPLDAHKD